MPSAKPLLTHLGSRPRLKADVSLEAAIKQLDEIASNGASLRGGVAGEEFDSLQRKYLDWVAVSAIKLRNWFSDSSIYRHLEDERYWYIRGLTPHSPLWMRLILDAIEDQELWLRDLYGFVLRLDRRLRSAPGRLTVIDTNVLLHFQPPEQVTWHKVVGEPEVRLVVPLRVIEELDEKKYLARADTADRARRLISQLRSLLGPTAGEPVPLRESVTIEVPTEDELRERPLDADTEILNLCRELQFASQPPVLVTDDGGMTLRGNALGFDVRRMPEKYLRGRP